MTLARAVSIAILVALPVVAAADDAGRALFQGLPGAEGAAVIGSNRVEAGRFPCRACHRRDGRGGGEGDAPPITWEALSNPDGLRPAYDPDSFARTLATGITPAGRELSRQMPRYNLPEATRAMLVGYLADLPRLQRRGILSDRIVLAVLQSPDDPEAADVAAGALRAAFDAQLPRAGLYGRTVEIRIFGGNPVSRDERLRREAAAIVAPLPLPERPLSLVALIGPPVLFPLAPVSEREDPTLVRSVLASREAIVRALAGRAARIEGRLVALADDPGDADAFAETLLDRDVLMIDSGSPIPADAAAVIALTTSRDALEGVIRKMPREAVLYADLDVLAPLRKIVEDSGIASVGGYGQSVLLRARDGAEEPPIEAFARVAARTLIEALGIAGRDVTQAALVDAVGKVRIAELGLDFEANRVSGTSDVMLVKLTTGR